MTAVEGQNAKDAGRRLGLSPGAVYVAKSRVLARLKEEISLLSDP
jgi:RNA polymerase sigma-70 factor (ECF subfamily)